MRIGIVCPYDLGEPGGVQQLTGELAANLRQAGDDVVIVGAGRAWFHGGPGLDEVTVPAGRAVAIRANLSRAPLTLDPTSWPRVRSVLSSVDVIHVHEPLVPLLGWIAMGLDRPTVATFHADAPRWVGRIYRFTPGLKGKFQKTVLSAVSSTAANALPTTWGPVHIVPNAIDVASYDVPVGRIERRVAFLGRDDPRKGLSLLLEAWPEIRSRAPDAELLVLGAQRPEAISGVTFMGPVSGGEKKRLLATSSVFVAPNIGGESFGIVVLEAMAAGCAVVASDIPAFVEVAGSTAVHVAAGDTHSLADAVTPLLLEPTRARAMAEASRKRARTFDWSEVIRSYRQLYQLALSYE